MRKQFVYILSFFWLFHFALPFLYQLLFGEVSIYSGFTGDNGFWVNTSVVLSSIFILYCFKIPAFELVKPFLKYAKIHYVISLLILILKFVLAGGYEGAINGTSSGTFISFLSLFFDVQYSFLFLFFFQKKLHGINWYIGSYIISLTLMGSRSAVITLLLLLLFFPLYQNSTQLLGKLKRIFSVFCLLAPLLFIGATLVRTEISPEFITKLIVGRISMIEISSIPLEGKDSGSYDKKQFLSKYSVGNQLEQSLNVLTPVDLFTYDISPNQYYRSIFLGYSDKFVHDVYTSMNLTFPVYWILLFNYSVGILLSIAILLVLFLFFVRFRRYRFCVTLFLCLIYETLYFFDIPMITQRAFSFVLTYTSLIIIERLCSSVLFTYKRYNL